MHDPHENKFVPVPEAMPADDSRHKWTRFTEGERFELRGVRMHVHEIGEKRLVLKLDE
jgi:hypothetical protein